MTALAWIITGTLMGFGCLLACAWWVRLTDHREPKYLSCLMEDHRANRRIGNYD